MDLFFMQRALELARRGIGFTSPNPCVGAVLVRSGKIIGEGWHHRAGTPHAEVHAVNDARRRGEKVIGSTLYVTLEPCCTHGCTPPCTDLIIREKIKRVVVAATDPNPLHAARGYKLLRQKGIELQAGVAETEAKELNRAFNHWIVHRHPWVIGKMALSLDGRIAGRPGDSRWLTGLAARRYAHHLRAESDAILIGASTARKDDPALTIRLAAYQKKIQPWRVVMARSGKLPRSLKIFADEHHKRTLVYKNKSLCEVLRELGSKGVTCALIEGGGRLLGRALVEGLVNEIVFFLAPMILGSKNEGIVLPTVPSWLKCESAHYRRLGGDVVCRATLCGNGK